MKDNKAFLVVGRDHKVIFWSDELAELTGYAAEEIVGGNMDPIIHPDLRTRHYAGFERAWDDNFVALSVKNPESSLDVPTHCKDGEYRNMRIMLSRANNSAGNLMVLIASFALLD
jgi:PAS domain S-box-containing protein